MIQGTIRRREGGGRVHDFVVQAESGSDLRSKIQSLLRTAQVERGTGVWSNGDPELWVQGALVGSLQRGGDVGQLASIGVERSGAAPPASRKH